MLREDTPSYADPAAMPFTIADASQLSATVTAGGELRATVALEGDLDLAGAQILAEAVRQQLSSGRRFVRLDLSRVRFLDASGLAAVAAAHNDLAAVHGMLVLDGAGPRIERLLAITHLDKALFVAHDGDRDNGRHLRSVRSPG